MNSLLDLLESFKTRGSSAALVFNNGKGQRETFSYGQLFTQAINFAGYLQSQGVGKGSVVALCMDRPVAWTVCFWGIVATGCTIVPLNPMLAASDAEKLSSLAGVKLIVTNKQDFFAQNIRTILLSGDMLAENVTPYVKPDIKPNDPAEIIFSSGTTGEPKALALSHKNLLANLQQLRQVHSEISAGSKFLCVLNLASSYQQMSGYFHPLCVGASIALLDSVDTESFIKAAVEEGTSVVLLVPSTLKKFKDYIEANHKEKWLAEVRKSQLKNFQFFISGGFALPPDVAQFWLDAGFTILEGYGLSECSPVLTVNRSGKIKMGSVGTALPGVELKIQDGEILAKGDNIFSGYLNNPEATKAAFTQEGWFKTGDIGHLDNEGFLYVAGRREDVEQAQAAGGVEFFKQAEASLLSTGAVLEVCVINILNKPIAVVIAKDKNLSPDVLLEQANSKLGQKLEKVVVWPGKDFPKTATGKVQKFRLRERFALNL